MCQKCVDAARKKLIEHNAEMDQRDPYCRDLYRCMSEHHWPQIQEIQDRLAKGEPVDTSAYPPLIRSVVANMLAIGLDHSLRVDLEDFLRIADENPAEPISRWRVLQESRTKCIGVFFDQVERRE